MNHLNLTWVVVPAYNEERMIGKVVRGLKEAGFKHVIVVDDGSSDETSMRAKNAGAVILRHSINRGAGAATITGFEAALKLGAEYIVTCDGDAQHDPEDILEVAQTLIKEGWDMVNGARFLGGNGEYRVPLKRRIYNYLGNLVTLLLTGVQVADSQSGLRAYKRESIEKMNLSADGMDICSEIFREAIKNHLSYKEISIKPIYTDYSLSKGQSMINGFRTVYGLILRGIIK